MGCNSSKKSLKTINEIRSTILNRLQRIEHETKEMKLQVKEIEQTRAEKQLHNQKVIIKNNGRK